MITTSEIVTFTIDFSIQVVITTSEIVTFTIDFSIQVVITTSEIVLFTSVVSTSKRRFLNLLIYHNPGQIVFLPRGYVVVPYFTRGETVIMCCHTFVHSFLVTFLFLKK